MDVIETLECIRHGGGIRGNVDLARAGTLVEDVIDTTSRDSSISTHRTSGLTPSGNWHNPHAFSWSPPAHRPYSPAPTIQHFPEIQLTFQEARVLGCLLEKEILTPGSYPLTHNSLLIACTPFPPWTKWRRRSRGSSNTRTARSSGGFRSAKAAGSRPSPTSCRLLSRTIRSSPLPLPHPPTPMRKTIGVRPSKRDSPAWNPRSPN